MEQHRAAARQADQLASELERTKADALALAELREKSELSVIDVESRLVTADSMLAEAEGVQQTLLANTQVGRSCGSCRTMQTCLTRVLLWVGSSYELGRVLTRCTCLAWLDTGTIVTAGAEGEGG
jgi:hypothetical protein